ncbi:MAG: CRISPR-associated endonuclease Cas2 [Halothiobacillaceae bacterium]
MGTRLWVVAYDISEDKTRLAVEKALLGRGERTQKSVFECFLTRDELTYLRGELARMIDPQTDSIRYYPLCGYCVGQVEYEGLGREPDDPDLYII